MSRFPQLERIALVGFAFALLWLLIIGLVQSWFLDIPLEGYLLLTPCNLRRITDCLSFRISLFGGRCLPIGRKTYRKKDLFLVDDGCRIGIDSKCGNAHVSFVGI